MLKLFDGHKTRIVGWILVAVAVLKTIADLFDGGGFFLAAHVDDLTMALEGAGLIALRDAIRKVQNVFDK